MAKRNNAVSLSTADVEKTALLARLRLDPAEVEKMTEQLGEVLNYIAQLESLDTNDVEPMAHAIDAVNIFADDEPHESFDRDSVLANAPKRDEECYRVPPVMGE